MRTGLGVGVDVHGAGQIFCAPTLAALIAAARFIPRRLCRVGVELLPLITRTPLWRQSTVRATEAAPSLPIVMAHGYGSLALLLRVDAAAFVASRTADGNPARAAEPSAGTQKPANPVIHFTAW